MTQLVQILCLLIVILAFTDHVTARHRNKLKKNIKSCSDKHICKFRTDDRKWYDIKCISHFEVCDGKIDCLHGDDEKNCRCLDGQHRCILKSDNTSGCATPCNGTVECLDRSDEEDCRCLDGQHRCILKSDNTSGCATPCNGTIECLDKSDEKDCLPICEEYGMLVCDSTGECVVACDGCVECPNAEDEAFCKGANKTKLAESPRSCCPENENATLLCLPLNGTLNDNPIMATAGDGNDECKDCRDEIPKSRSKKSKSCGIEYTTLRYHWFCDCEITKVPTGECCMLSSTEEHPLPCVCENKPSCDTR